MSGIQVLAAAFAVGMGYQAFIDHRRGELSAAGVVLWMALWVGLLAVTLFPGAFQRLVAPVHVARLLDLVTISGLLVMAFVTYRLHVMMRRVQRSLETLVRELALRDLPTDLAR